MHYGDGVARPEVPEEWVQRCDHVLAALPRCRAEAAWTGVRWRVGNATVAHIFGGEDQRFRIVLRAEPDEVLAFEAMGEPYFRAGWGTDVVGLVIDDTTDWDEVEELLVASYCVQAPRRLAEEVLQSWASGGRA
ncbi:hypothetical protein GCM10023341_15730 [Ornithinimicrobium tianjinense]